MRTKEETITFLQELYAHHFGCSPFDESPTCDSFVVFASAPGRVEIAGNHTDHQGGCTISAGIDRRIYALAAPNHNDEIHVFMDDLGKAALKINDLNPREAERASSLSLIRGMAAAYAQSGRLLQGFNMVVCSDIPIGQGLSSSAAFEMLIGVSIRALCNKDDQNPSLDLTALALEGVAAEQSYFGKPCGAQDQLASAYGGIVTIDFSDKTPLVTPLVLDQQRFPYTLCLVDSQSNHAHLTDEFAAIPADMHAVAQHFGYRILEELPYETFLNHLPQVRAQLGDRASLRALHYFEETRRVKAQVQALQKGNFDDFIEKVRLSGASSAQFLQNVSCHTDTADAAQSAMVVLALCSHLLDNALENKKGSTRGACRIHGGGFGGSILAFVPSSTFEAFNTSMNELLGYSACMPITISTQGVQAERLNR